MTTCRALDCIYNSREDKEKGVCTLNDDMREINEQGICISYQMDHQYQKNQRKEQLKEKPWLKPPPGKLKI